MVVRLHCEAPRGNVTLLPPARKENTNVSSSSERSHPAAPQLPHTPRCRAYPLNNPPEYTKMSSRYIWFALPSDLSAPFYCSNSHPLSSKHNIYISYLPSKWHSKMWILSLLRMLPVK